MNKHLLSPILLVIIILLMGSCSTPTTLVPATATATLPATETASPTATPAPPTKTPTPLPPTALPTPENAIQHFPAGQEFTVTAINMIDANTGWAIGGLVGVGDHVLYTSDGGTTWSDVTSPEQEATSPDRKNATGYFLDARKAWVIYSNTSGTTPEQSVIWRTQDGGATWQPSQPLDLADLNEFYNPSDLQFADEQHGWVMVHVGVGMNHDYIVLYRTADGGATWERLIDPYNDTTGIMGCSKTGMLFTDATHGWLTGDCNGVAAGALLFKTGDGGATWENIKLPEPSSYPGIFSNESMIACGTYDPFFFGNDVGHIAVNCHDFSGTQVSYFYYIFTTQDGGATWTSSTYPGEGLYFFTKDLGWALSKTIQKTTDGGQTWSAIADVTWSIRVDFVSEQDGWGVARSGDLVALVKTTDGGVHWSMLTPKIGEG